MLDSKKRVDMVDVKNMADPLNLFDFYEEKKKYELEINIGADGYLKMNGLRQAITKIKSLFNITWNIDPLIEAQIKDADIERISIILYTV
jgi:hypothetical protein